MSSKLEDFAETLKDFLERTEKENLKETEVRSLLVRIASYWNWPFSFCKQEVGVPGTQKRMDLVLRSSKKDLVAFELKRPSVSLEDLDQQLANYIWKQDFQLAVLTNGCFWKFWLPKADGCWEERLAFEVEVSQKSLDETAKLLYDLLSFENVISGETEKVLKEKLKEKQLERQKALERDIVLEELEKLWKKLLKNPPEELLLLLGDMLEKRKIDFWEEEHLKSFLHQKLNVSKKLEKAPRMPQKRQPKVSSKKRNSKYKHLPIWFVVEKQSSRERELLHISKDFDTKTLRQEGKRIIGAKVKGTTKFSEKAGSLRAWYISCLKILEGMVGEKSFIDTLHEFEKVKKPTYFMSEGSFHLKRYRDKKLGVVRFKPDIWLYVNIGILGYKQMLLELWEFLEEKGLLKKEAKTPQS